MLPFIFNPPESSETYTKKMHETMKSVRAYVTRTHQCPDSHPNLDREPRPMDGLVVGAKGMLQRGLTRKNLTLTLTVNHARTGLEIVGLTQFCSVLWQLRHLCTWLCHGMK